MAWKTFLYNLSYIRTLAFFYLLLLPIDTFGCRIYVCCIVMGRDIFGESGSDAGFFEVIVLGFRVCLIIMGVSQHL